jgi:hypothetical protein
VQSLTAISDFRIARRTTRARLHAQTCGCNSKRFRARRRMPARLFSRIDSQIVPTDFCFAITASSLHHLPLTIFGKLCQETNMRKQSARLTNVRNHNVTKVKRRGEAHNN